MKKFLSLMLVLALGCGTLSFAGCDGDLPTGETGENVTLTETEGQTPNPSEKSYYIELSENPILEGMESFEMEEFLEALQPYADINIARRVNQLCGDYIFYQDPEEHCNLYYQSRKNPMEKGIPLSFDGSSKIAGKSLNDLYVHFFLVDPILTRENGGVPVLHLMVSEERYGEFAYLVRFDVKTQELTLLYDSSTLSYGKFYLYGDRLYFFEKNDEGRLVLKSIKTDGSDFRVANANYHEDKSRISDVIDVEGGRIYYENYCELHSCALDLSDDRLEMTMKGSVLVGERISNGYLYFTTAKAQYRQAGDFSIPCKDYIRAPLSDLTDQKIVLEGVGLNLPDDGGDRIFFKKPEDVLPSVTAAVSYAFRTVYCLDLNTGTERAIFTQEEERGRGAAITLCAASSREIIFRLIRANYRLEYVTITL
ncbi:MAG: hypothetical protein IKD31_00925 [Clostridia bacterium]|nr:hypothetical protein [Clostridia bacterium]